MKITHKELCQFYESYLDDNVPLSRKECPSLKKIIKFFNPQSSPRHKARIVDHLSQCIYCAQEFRSLLQILRSEKKLNEEIGHWLLEKNSSPLLERPDERNHILGLSWRYLWLLLGGVFIIFSFLVSFNKNLSWNLTEPEGRGDKANQIYLIEPKNGNYIRSRLTFQWAGLPESEYFILEIYDETLAPVWKSPKIFGNTCSLPEETVKKLIKQRSYFWMITVYLENGERHESALETFTLRD